MGYVNLSNVEGTTVNLGRFSFKSVTRAVQSVAKPVQKVVAKVTAPVQKIANVQTLKKVAKAVVLPASVLPKSSQSMLKKVVKTAILPGSLILDRKTSSAAPTQEYAAVPANEYRDSQGNVITEAQYNQIMAEGGEYYDANGTRITKAQYDALMAQAQAPQYPQMQTASAASEYAAVPAEEPIYTDANGNQISKAQYDALMQMYQASMTATPAYQPPAETYTDAEGNPISYEQYMQAWAWYNASMESGVSTETEPPGIIRGDYYGGEQVDTDPWNTMDDAAFTINASPDPATDEPITETSDEAMIAQADNDTLTPTLETLAAVPVVVRTPFRNPRHDVQPMDAYAAIPPLGGLGRWDIKAAIRNPAGMFRKKNVLRTTRQVWPYAAVVVAAAATVASGGAAAPALVGAGLNLAKTAKNTVDQERAQKAADDEAKAIRAQNDAAAQDQALIAMQYHQQDYTIPQTPITTAAPGSLPEGDYSGEYAGDGQVPDFFDVSNIMG